MTNDDALALFMSIAVLVGGMVAIYIEYKQRFR